MRIRSCVICSPLWMCILHSNKKQNGVSGRVSLDLITIWAGWNSQEFQLRRHWGATSHWAGFSVSSSGTGCADRSHQHSHRSALHILTTHTLSVFIHTSHLIIHHPLTAICSYLPQAVVTKICAHTAHPVNPPHIAALRSDEADCNVNTSCCFRLIWQSGVFSHTLRLNPSMCCIFRFLSVDSYQVS